MSRGLIVRSPGGPEALEWVDLPAAAPGLGEVLLRQTAVGVNFIDVYYRSGLYPWPQTPLVPGAEAAGVVEEVGPGVIGLETGDRVVYTVPTGAYREMRVMPAERLVKLPEGLTSEVIAGAFLKGLTTQYLVTGSYVLKPGDTILVHAAAGGVGQLLGQWAAAIGATAIGTAGGPEKCALARTCGYAHVIDYRSEDFVAEVMRITDGRGCEAVYDSVGADTWRGSLACLALRGSFVSFGQSSGKIEGFQMLDLAKGSYTAVRPVLFHYIASRAELESRSADLFARILDGSLKVDISAVYRLEDAARAQRDLEARRTTGSVILTV